MSDHGLSGSESSEGTKSHYFLHNGVNAAGKDSALSAAVVLADVGRGWNNRNAARLCSFLASLDNIKWVCSLLFTCYATERNEIQNSGLQGNF